MNLPTRILTLGAAASIAIAATTSASAVNIKWTDWTADTSASSPELGFTAVGTITTTTSTVDVTYQNNQGIGFFQDGVNGNTFDYFRNDLGAAGSPYTSSYVDNIPTAAEMIALTYAGLQTLTFSQTVENLVFSYISLNGNGYSFDQDFDILSFGHSSDGNYNGNYGPGTSYKNIVDLGGGNFEYQLLGSGEPHGTIRFKDTFDSVSWTSLSNEYWNGFTVGVEGTEREVSGVPDTSNTAFLALLGFAAVIAGRKRLISPRS